MVRNFGLRPSMQAHCLTARFSLGLGRSSPSIAQLVVSLNFVLSIRGAKQGFPNARDQENIFPTRPRDGFVLHFVHI